MPISLPGFVLDAKVRNGDFVSYHPQPVPGGDLRPRVSAKPGYLAIDSSFQFIIQNYAEIPPAFLNNPSCFLLIEAIEVCVVIGLSGFNEAVVDGLAFRDEAVRAQQAMSSLVSVNSSRGLISGPLNVPLRASPCLTRFCTSRSAISPRRRRHARRGRRWQRRGTCQAR